MPQEFLNNLRVYAQRLNQSQERMPKSAPVSLTFRKLLGAGADGKSSSHQLARCLRATQEFGMLQRPLDSIQFKRKTKTSFQSCATNHRPQHPLNTDLAKKLRECLEYIVLHELVHVVEPTHDARFIALMDQLMPQWRERRRQLNRMPLSHDSWTY